MSHSALELSGRTHQVLSDLNISYGRKGPLGSSKSVVMSSPMAGNKSGNLYRSGSSMSLSRSANLGRDHGTKRLLEE